MTMRVCDPMLKSAAPTSALIPLVLFILAGCASDDGQGGAGDPGGASGADKGGAEEAAGEPSAAGETEPASPAEAEGEEMRAYEHDHPDDPPEQPGPLEPGEAGHYGAEFDDPDAEPLGLAEAIGACANTDEVCKFEGRVETVCTTRGCWMTLRGPEEIDESVRVRMKDYAFLMPPNSPGRRAIVEGAIELVEVPEDRAAHYAEKEAESAGEEPRDVEGPEPTYQVNARGIELGLEEDEAS